MKSFKIKELFRFAGCVVEKFFVEKAGVQVAMRCDGRCKPGCPDCRVPLKEVRAGKIAVYDLPLADRNTVWVTLPAVQGRCPQCRMLITPRPPEVHPTRDATWRLMRAVAAWAAFCRASSVATLFAISEGTVRRYEMDVLNADLPALDLDNLEILLVDDKSVRKGHGYVTVVLNGPYRRAAHMAEGKKKESLESFLSLLTDRQKASIRAVCIDRNGAYRFVLSENLPGAEIVHDRFHIIANLNTALDEVRRSEWRAANAERKKVIKGSRYLLLSGCGKLDGEGFARLAELTGLNAKISTGYILKEEFRHIYAVATSARSGAVRIRRWCGLVGDRTAAPLRTRLAP